MLTGVIKSVWPNSVGRATYSRCAPEWDYGYRSGPVYLRVLWSKLSQMTGGRYSFCFLSFVALILAGCAETPKRQTMRPIPPPPSAPPPGAVYTAPLLATTNGMIISGVTTAPPPNASAPPAVMTTNVTTGVAATTNSVAEWPGAGGMEVSSNFQATAQSPPPGTSPEVVATVPPGQPQGVPQYEVVPDRPGPDYDWVDGYWAWQGAAWVWIPGRWVWHPEPRVIVTPGFYWGYGYRGPYYRHHPGGWYGPRPYRRWR